MADQLTPTASAASTLAVETDGLTKRFGDRVVVDGVDLRIPRGVAFGYLGPNGAGKTTLIRTLLALTPATSGSMRILGFSMPEARSEALARVGAIVEEPSFHGHLTGRENLALADAARGGASASLIDDVLDRIGLRSRARDRVKTYSLGMRQRLGIARCLLADPEMLILDEPMNGLDPAGIQEFRVFVRDFVAEGRTVVLSSHLLDEVEKTCDHIAIVDNGNVVVQGSIEELRADGGCTHLTIEIDDTARGRALLAGDPVVERVLDDGRSLMVTLAQGGTAAAVNRRLVEAGLAVARLEPSRASLEQRFLDVTTRLENAA